MTKSTSPRRARAFVVPVGIIVASIGSLAALSSGAWFTDSAVVDSNTFSTGTVDINATPATSALTMTNMAPGDAVVGQIQVQNTGSLAAKYDISGQVTGTVQAALRTTVKTGVTSCTVAGFNGTGTVVYNAAAIPTSKTLLASRPSLAAAANENLCFKVELPGSTTGNTYQSTNATAVFTFDAVQSTNNP